MSRLCLLILCLITGGSLSVCYGQDINWDLQNYHLYNAFQFLDDRLRKDFMAAGIQTYLNPLLDLPYYYLSVAWFPDSPAIVAFIMGLPYGMVIFLCLLIANEISLSLPHPKEIEVFGAAAFGLTGTIVLSEVGATFNDLQIAALVLLALLFELKAVESKNYRGVPSGVMLGLAAGLKMTSAIFAPAMLAAVLATSKSLKTAWRAGALFCLFWGAGFSISGGFWAYILFKIFENPIFPFFNSFFHSPWYVFDGGGRDTRFMPQNWFEAVFYPFYWLSGTPKITELPMRDGRYAAAFISVIVFGLLFFINHLKPAALAHDLKPLLKNIQARLVLVFFTFSYIAWEIVFSIGRYAIPLEILTGIPFLIVYKLCDVPCKAKSLSRRIVRAAAALIFITILSTSLPISWGRAHYAHNLLPYSLIKSASGYRMPENSTVFIFGKPIAYAIPFIDSPGSVYYGLSDGIYDLPASSPAIRKFSSRLKENGPVFVLTTAADAAQARGALLKIADLTINSPQCIVINDKFRPSVTKLCPVMGKSQ